MPASCSDRARASASEAWNVSPPDSVRTPRRSPASGGRRRRTRPCRGPGRTARRTARAGCREAPSTSESSASVSSQRSNRSARRCSASDLATWAVPVVARPRWSARRAACARRSTTRRVRGLGPLDGHGRGLAVAGRVVSRPAARRVRPASANRRSSRGHRAGIAASGRLGDRERSVAGGAARSPRRVGPACAAPRHAATEVVAVGRRRAERGRARRGPGRSRATPRAAAPRRRGPGAAAAALRLGGRARTCSDAASTRALGGGDRGQPGLDRLRRRRRGQRVVQLGQRGRRAPRAGRLRRDQRPVELAQRRVAARRPPRRRASARLARPSPVRPGPRSAPAGRRGGIGRPAARRPGTAAPATRCDAQRRGPVGGLRRLVRRRGPRSSAAGAPRRPWPGRRPAPSPARSCSASRRWPRRRRARSPGGQAARSAYASARRASAAGSPAAASSAAAFSSRSSAASTASSAVGAAAAGRRRGDSPSEATPSGDPHRAERGELALEPAPGPAAAVSPAGDRRGQRGQRRPRPSATRRAGPVQRAPRRRPAPCRRRRRCRRAGCGSAAAAAPRPRLGDAGPLPDPLVDVSPSRLTRISWRWAGLACRNARELALRQHHALVNCSYGRPTTSSTAASISAGVPASTCPARPAGRRRCRTRDRSKPGGSCSSPACEVRRLALAVAAHHPGGDVPGAGRLEDQAHPRLGRRRGQGVLDARAGRPSAAPCRRARSRSRRAPSTCPSRSGRPGRRSRRR